MKIARLRLVFAALTIALAIPGALLVRRALASVAAEREARERAVAERVFDEMERSLTELLREEEGRPVGDYDFASAASPLREKPADAVALGWFQIEADGRVTTPSWAPRAAAFAEEVAARGARFERIADRQEPELPAKAARDSLVGRTSPPPKPDAVLEAPPVERAALEGAAGRARDGIATTSEAPAPAPERKLEPDAVPSPQASAPPSDAYDALAKLNTGAKEREQRKQRVYVQEQASASPAAPPAPSAAEPVAAEAPSGELADDARARSEQLVAQAMSDASASPEWSEPTTERGTATSNAALGVGAERAPSDEKDAPAAAAGTPAASKRSRTSAGGSAPLGRQGATAQRDSPGSGLVRVVVDPLRGRVAQSGELVLVRSAWIGARGVRQGVAFEVSAIERALAAAALRDGALSGAALRVTPAARLGVPTATPGVVSFPHRFAEPFDALAAELSFARFADEGASTVAWLAGLFALAGVGGLFAVYRMTAVALHFAERRTNFAAAVSHELKTPLTAIRLYAEMLRDGVVASDEKRGEYYGSIAAETERLSRLIDNVLEFSRLEKGTRHVALALGDVAAVVREAAQLLRPHAAQHGLALELAVDDALPPARFERDALLQIVFNLVDNAVKYGRGEPAVIEIACRRAGDGVALVVRDHGPGVPRDELARILEPFYRRGDELTRSAPGAGIGLALVRSLAQQMGAALAVANAPGGGLAVTLTLRA
jgi:signal transduction histidine kinase